MNIPCRDCREDKGRLDFREDDVVFLFDCPHDHPNKRIQALSIKQTLKTILRREPDWLDKFYVDLRAS